MRRWQIGRQIGRRWQRWQIGRCRWWQLWCWCPWRWRIRCTWCLAAVAVATTHLVHIGCGHIDLHVIDWIRIRKAICSQAIHFHKCPGGFGGRLLFVVDVSLQAFMPLPCRLAEVASKQCSIVCGSLAMLDRWQPTIDEVLGNSKTINEYMYICIYVYMYTHMHTYVCGMYACMHLYYKKTQI